MRHDAGYVIRLMVWAGLVVGIGAAGLTWSTRTVPARVEAMKAAPPKPPRPTRSR